MSCGVKFYLLRLDRRLKNGNTLANRRDCEARIGIARLQAEAVVIFLRLIEPRVGVGDEFQQDLALVGCLAAGDLGKTILRGIRISGNQLQPEFRIRAGIFRLDDAAAHCARRHFPIEPTACLDRIREVHLLDQTEAIDDRLADVSAVRDTHRHLDLGLVAEGAVGGAELTERAAQAQDIGIRRREGHCRPISFGEQRQQREDQYQQREYAASLPRRADELHPRDRIHHSPRRPHFVTVTKAAVLRPSWKMIVLISRILAHTEVD